MSRYHIVCTSNLASNEILELRHSSVATIERHVLGRARESLRPEIFNRFDETLVYRPLEFGTQVEIAEAKIAGHLDSLRAKGFVLSVGPGVTAFLVRQGIDRKFGARPLLRAIRKHVGNAVVEHLRAGGDGSGQLEVHGECLVLRNTKTASKQERPAR